MKNLIIILVLLILFSSFVQAKVIEPELVSDEVIIKGDFNNFLNQKYIIQR